MIYGSERRKAPAGEKKYAGICYALRPLRVDALMLAARSARAAAARRDDRDDRRAETCRSACQMSRGEAVAKKNSVCCGYNPAKPAGS